MAIVQSREELHQIQHLQSLDTVHQVNAKNRRQVENEAVLTKARNETALTQQQSTLAQSTSEASIPDCGKKPTIAKPATSGYFNPFEGDAADENINIVSVCRQALACQLTINSQFWSNSWQQASQTMTMYANFAPVVYNATLADWNGQAQVTSDQGQKAKEEGQVMGILAITSIGMGVAQTIKAGSEIKGGIALADEAKSAEAGRAVMAGEGAGPVGDGGVDGSIDDAARAENGSALSRGWAASKAGIKWTVTKFAETAANTANAAQFNQLMSNAAVNYIVEPKWATTISKDQTAVGQAEATAKQTEMFGQYYSTQSNRTYDLGSGSSQMIDYCYNLLTSIADNVAATSRQMFQG